MNEDADQSERKVDKSVRDLQDDYERQGGMLLQKQIERLLAKRGLNARECADVISRLAAAGIAAPTEVKDDFENSLNTDSGSGKSTNEILNQDKRDFDRNEIFTDYASLTKHFGLSLFKKNFLTPEEEIDAIRSVHLANKFSNENDAADMNVDSIQKIIKNGEKSQEKLIVSNIRFIIKIASSYTGVSSLSLSDLVQEGIVGMIKSIEKFDFSFENRFQTYAVWWIKQSIMKAISDQGSVIRLPSNLYREALLYKKAYRFLFSIHPGRPPTIRELADELSWDLDKVAFLKYIASFTFASIDSESSNGEESTLLERLESGSESPDELADATDQRELIRGILSGLGKTERSVMEMRFALGKEGIELTLREVGDRLGLSGERVRQIESKALVKVRLKLWRLSDYNDRMEGYLARKAAGGVLKSNPKSYRFG